MAYRFDGTSEYMQFATAPFLGYTFDAFTLAVLLKRNVVSGSTTYEILGLTSATAADRLEARIVNNQLQMVYGASGPTGSPVFTSTGIWYLIAATKAAGGTTISTHWHDGTSWTHAVISPVSGTVTIGVGNLLQVGKNQTGSIWLPGDMVCCGIKKADSADAAIETLSPTGFASWRSFGFDWLVGFDAAAPRKDLASPGTGDEIARTGTSLVSDPTSWAWGDVTAPALGTQTTKYETGGPYARTPNTAAVPASTARGGGISTYQKAAA